MGVTLDTKKAHLTRQLGDVTCIFTWMNDERCMILLPTYRTGAPWFVVMESASYSWNDEEFSNVSNVVSKATKACEVLGIEATPHNVRKIAAIVIDGLPDLIRMPSSPPAEFYNTNFGAMTLRADGKEVAQQDIRVQKEGVTYG